LQHQPDSPKALSMMAELLQQQRRTDEALEYARRLYQAGPHSQRATLAYANLLVQHQEAEQARQVLLPLWERQPSAPAARLLGALEAQKRNWQTAKNYFAKAYQEQSDPSLLQMMLQVEQHVAGDQGVQALLQQHLEHHPEGAYARLRLAILYQQLEETDEAIQHYESVKQLQPDNPIAWNNLAWLYFNIGDQRSLAHAQEAFRLAPQRPDIQDTLGWILLNQGNKQEGLKMLARAVEGLPNTPEVRFHHAAALVENNRSDEARPTLEKLAQDESSVQQQAAVLLRQLDQEAEAVRDADRNERL
jgi:tetratricopeptide (TPR) repeat protein